MLIIMTHSYDHLPVVKYILILWNGMSLAFQGQCNKELLDDVYHIFILTEKLLACVLVLCFMQ